MEVKARARFVRVSPRKIRYIRPIVIGKEAVFALDTLKSSTRHGCEIVRKLVQSAMANAKQKNPEGQNWYVKNFTIDEGPKMKRMRSAPMGRAVVIRKGFSHLTVVLEEMAVTKKTKRKEHGSKS